MQLFSSAAEKLRKQQVASTVISGGWTFTRRNQLSGSSAEKVVCSGIGVHTNGETKAVALCFSELPEEAENMKREQKLLEHLGKHPHIVEFVDFVSNWGGENGPECLLLELVEPLGYDLFEVCVQAHHAVHTIPLSQVRHYMGQLGVALDHLHSKGVVHRDIKAENVMIQGRHCVKLIDFGLAVCPALGIEFPAPLTAYIAPELMGGYEAGSGSPAADLWGVGLVVYLLCVGVQPMTQMILDMIRRGGFSDRLRNRGVHAGAVEAVEHLLKMQPEERWSLEQLKAWAEGGEQDSGPLDAPDQVLRRFHSKEDLPQAFGAQLPNNWQHNGTTILDMGFMAQAGLQILLVVRNATWKRFYDQWDRPYYENLHTQECLWEKPDGMVEVVNVPVARTELRSSDWIYFGLNSTDENTSVEAQMRFVANQMGLPVDQGVDIDVFAKGRGNRHLTPFLPDFDAFVFPVHCVNAVLGPHSAGEHIFAKEGQNALNLRNKFGINVAGLARPDGTVLWWPGADVAVGHGDRGLVMRVPQSYADNDVQEPSLPSVELDVIKGLLEEDRFRQRLQLQDEASWKAWSANIPEVPEDLPTSPKGGR